MKKERKVKKQKELKIKKAKKQKNDTYIMRKNAAMKGLRAVLWLLLAFIFVKGILVSIRPDRTDEVAGMIENFKSEFYAQKDTNDEVFGFAQNFTQEYLTYEVDGQKDFQERIKPYVSPKIYEMNDIYDFKSKAKTIYVQAYRKVEYSSNQLDVYVKATVEYEMQQLTEDKTTYETVSKCESSTLKVPVSIQNNGFCIEDLPMYVSDSLLDECEYNNLVGEELESNEYNTAITNFLMAYYSQEQSVIDYYLSSDADKSKFMGLNTRYQFNQIRDLSVYKTDSGKVICLVKVGILDSVNAAVVSQQFNVQVIKDGDRIYIQDINTKTANLKE
ncbi:conjugal transfer protein [Anaeromicropila populeti]|uniref:Conjugative transposon protein TcpC n=1 Tax=Anaeromicropila populeti TaxID=37658 RepID=A0A1I6LX33_9FIRM|nr:conjugal transfer protein [Anaeromicropila populeti]SFS08031.1 Conjugative transposon protein TcpC [Anaeromicropila populeti]